MDIEIKALRTNPGHITALSGLLIEATANGASIGFMHPLVPAKAEAFWQEALRESDKGHQVIFGAFHNSPLVGTVTLCPAKKENQPHRAEIVKLIVAVSHRGQGIAKMLMRAAENRAVEIGKSLLVLDTTTGSTAAKLYEKERWTLAGSIPDYAHMPDGTLSGTSHYWKKVGKL
jgi:ribosomal protein S18 acetylase RimI-like enzyme